MSREETLAIEDFFALLRSGAPTTTTQEPAASTKEAATADENSNLVIEKIKQLKELLDLGAITQEEFDEKKNKLLSKF